VSNKRVELLVANEIFVHFCTHFSRHPLRASSILQKNSKLYGPANALDTANDSSCWNSEGIEGSTQWFLVDFGRTVQPSSVRIQFQAGFVTESCRVEGKLCDESWETLDEVEWEDVHEMQKCALETTKPCTAVKLVLDDFTDFYGRVTIYKLEIWGKEMGGIDS